jgi:hypothetical protein
MKAFTLAPTIFLLALFLVACHQSEEVVSRGMIQKRKHLPGFHLNIKQQSYKHLDAKNGHDSTSELAVSSYTNGMPPRIALLAEAAYSDTNIVINVQSGAATISYTDTSDKLLKKPSVETSTIASVAQARTEELTELKKAKENNKRNIKSSGIISAFSIASVIMGAVGLLMGGPLVFIGYGITSLGIAIGRFSIPILIIYLIERSHLNDGQLYFDESRIEKFNETAFGMHRIQRITSLMLIASLGAMFALLFTIPFLAIIPYVFLLFSAGANGLASTVGIILSFLTRKSHPDSKSLLVKLIAWRVLTNMILTVALGFLVILFYNFFLLSL